MTTVPPVRSESKLLLEFVRSQDVTCPLCNYNLRALTVPRCPECGRLLKLTVGTVEPFLAAWILLAIAAFGSSGIAILLDLFSLFKGGHPKDFMATCALYSFNLSVPLALGAVCFRRQFLRSHTSIQWLIAAAALLLTAGQIGGFIYFVR